jgi:ATP-dependent DNA ligase
MPELMKGHTWRDHSHKMTYPCAVEVKYDEIRCHVRIQNWGPDPRPVEFLSYAGKPLANMEVFAPYFLTLARVTGYHEFDCGIEVNGNFNDSYRWVRSTKALPEDLVNARVKFMLYDLPELDGATYWKRSALCDGVVKAWADWCSAKYAMHVPYAVRCVDKAEVEATYKEFIESGFEGAMVKTLDHLYQRKRTYTWLKLKPEEDADGVITHIHMAYAGKDQPELGIAVGDALGRAGSVTIRMEDGSTADAHGIRHDLAADMIANPQAYIGQWAEFVYMERDRQGGYRHPRFKRLREAKA